jgi:mono/diheme cytochrome c family protein
MGKTGHLGPPPFSTSPESSQPLLLSPGSLNDIAALSGSDMYRFNCRGCHGEQGLGAPPEIRALINPVRATSLASIMELMKSRGLDISHAQALQMAEQARTAISDRLHNGGESMPPFNYLKTTEVRSLTGYLEQLADVPARQEYVVQESSLRVGELIVRSTCHICHDATGANPTPEQILQGAIPPLATLTSRKNELEFIRKVTQGAPILMGTPPMLQRGRMPVFYYITPDEAADVYRYLTLYPPRSDQGNRVSPLDQRQLITLVTGSDGLPASTRTLTEAFDGRSILLMMALGAFVFLLIGIGLALTASEFVRLSPPNAAEQALVEQTRPNQQEVYSK